MKLSTEHWNRMLHHEEQAFSQCYRQASPIIYTVIFRICNCKTTAQDILQETFIHAFSNLNTLKEPEKFLAWLKRIAFNKTISWIRANNKHLNTIDIDEFKLRDSSASLEIRHQVTNDLSLIMEKLSPQSRLILWLYAIEGYSHQEIAKMHEKSVSYSKTIISRALGALKNDYKVAINAR